MDSNDGNDANDGSLENLESKTIGTYDVPVEKVWKVISDFTNLEWVSYVSNVISEGNRVGSHRTVTIQSPEMETFELVEELTKLDNENHITAITILKGPPLWAGAVCDMIARKLDENKSEVEFRYKFDPGQIPKSDAKKMADYVFEVARDDLEKFLKR
ncbi:MAG TPA: SRPBCC family protein [Nitrosopumilus sp.]